MKPIAIAIILLASAASLASCGNTAKGMARDGRETSHALDDATHRVLSTGANKK